MIAMIACAKRKAGMSLAEFNRYWIEKHAPLVRSVPEFMRHVRKYVQYQVSADDSTGTSPFGGGADHDGVGALWFDSRESMATAFSEPKYLEIIRPDELKFLDLERCVIFITQELIVHDEIMAPARELAISHALVQSPSLPCGGVLANQLAKSATREELADPNLMAPDSPSRPSSKPS